MPTHALVQVFGRRHNKRRLALRRPAVPPGPRALAQQPANPLVRAYSGLVGALAVPATSARQPVDPTPAATSSGWAVQLAAPKSETEAKSDAARLNAKYASALNGAAIGVHKAQVNGYRLRVAAPTRKRRSATGHFGHRQ